eukprot:14397158-Ditylum_brightwellii.AAC.1
MARCAPNSYLPNRLDATVFTKRHTPCEAPVCMTSFSFMALPLNLTVLSDDPIKLRHNCQCILRHTACSSSFNSTIWVIDAWHCCSITSK